MGPDRHETQSGYYLTGQVVAANDSTVGNAYMRSLQEILGAPASGISQDSTCICLPARSRFGGGRGIFDQPGKNELFNKLMSSAPTPILLSPDPLLSISLVPLH